MFAFATRAIHLEILSDLTSDAIIATLKTLATLDIWMSRRGKCSKIFKDKATNFVGANSQLKAFYKTLNFPDQNLAAYFTEEGIEWNFIPPRAPHMGGGHKVSEISPQASTGKIPTHIRGV
ncbi:integrase catalytic domain-containing protein [Trichonephila clavipes]|nr:integrase catalytic domain-containing protein [Trichonephila clavipes]